MNPEPTDQLALALEATGRLIDSVEADQWNRATPCAEWSVRDIVAHLAVGNAAFEAALRGRPPVPILSPDAGGPDLPGAYQRSVEGLLDAFRQPGALDNAVKVPLGTVPGIVAAHLRMTEALVHGWDLAQATGQPAAFPDDLAEQELAFTRAKLGDIPAGRTPFAPPQPVADDASAIERLAACLGRTVAADTQAGW